MLAEKASLFLRIFMFFCLKFNTAYESCCYDRFNVLFYLHFEKNTIKTKRKLHLCRARQKCSFEVLSYSELSGMKCRLFFGFSI